MRKIDLKNSLIMMIDIGFVYYAFFFASLLLHDFRMHDEIETVIQSFPWLLPLYVLIFILSKLYGSVWEYASIDEALNVFLALVTGFIFTSVITIICHLSLQPNLLILSHVILFLGLIGVRYCYRFMNCINRLLNRNKNTIRTIVIGAGSAGNLLIKELKGNNAILNQVVCLVDDDIKKLGKVIQGVKVVGTVRQLKYLVFKYQIEEVIVSIPSASQIEYQRILKSCEDLKIKIKVFPPFYELLKENKNFLKENISDENFLKDNKSYSNETFSIDKIREVEIEDLLGRDEVDIDCHGLVEFLSDEVVLVSGGGGSIGSELCRQIVKLNPKSIIIFDQYENNAYEIQNELVTEISKMDLKPKIEVLIGSVQDEDRLNEIFSQYSISLVFHAAAHKHVPLMEDSPREAIKNNVCGTYLIAKLAHKYKVKKFVLISSDKAVNPTNIMGATKRLSEMIINAFNGISLTQYAAVRFGNVLGSNGSVVPLFKKQIRDGGPVTVTHKEVIRYFMTISEAVSLVLQAGAYARGGEIFVLDMGEPVKILELAENLIRLSGYEPYRDINILITGLRPGDKLYEELLRADENLQKTAHEKIFFLRQKLIYLDHIEAYLEELKYAVTLKNVNIPQVISKLIPTYHHPSMKEGIV